MTEKNTEIMRDAFRLLAEFEKPPEPGDNSYWPNLMKKQHEMKMKWQGDPLAVYLSTAVCDALAAEQKRMYPEQIKMTV